MVIDLFSSFPSIAQWLVMLLVAGTLGYVLHYLLSRKKWARSFRSMENRLQALEYQNRKIDELKQQQSFLFDSNNDLAEKLNEHDHLLKLQKKGKKGDKTLNAPNFVLLSDFNEYVTRSSTKSNDFQNEMNERICGLEEQHAEWDFNQWTKKLVFVQQKQEDFEADNYRQDKEIENLKAKWKEQGTPGKTAEKRFAKSSAKSTSSFSKKEALRPAEPLLQRLSIKNITATAANKDDLKLIKGVGPFIEKKVNKLGIYSFEQISQLTDSDIEAITEAIEFFPGRIQRDDWKSQAKELMKKKVS